MEVLEFLVIGAIPADVAGGLIVDEGFIQNARFRVVTYYSFVPSFDETKSSLILPDDVISEGGGEMIGRTREPRGHRCFSSEVPVHR